MVLPPLAVQLYSVRTQLAQDFEATVRKVAAMGYAGVETAGFPGTTPKAAARLFQELGLAVCASHIPMPIGDGVQQTLDVVLPLSCRRAVCAWLPPERFRSLDAIDRVADELNQAAANLAPHGIDFFYHNHEFEFQPVAGRTAYSHLLERLQPNVLIEVDVYWAQTAGVDPAQLLQELGRRSPLVHLKDGPCARGVPMTALGQGRVDIAGVMAVAANNADWFIVEIDECAGDMMQAIADSYRFAAALRGAAEGAQ